MLQKLAYLSVVVAFPVLVLAGLTMSPAIDATFPWLVSLFHGRQSARTIHFVLATYLVAFVAVHLLMVVLSGVFNNMRSMITGRYRIPEESKMSRSLLLSRRSILRGVAAGGLLPLAGCSLDSRSAGVMSVLDKAETLTEAAQRALLAPRLALAPEYPPGAISREFKPNGSIDPDDPDYVALKENGFADWRLEVGGLVERPMKLWLADLRALPSRSQITRHDCVEGWSCIGKWTGAQLSAAARPPPA